MADKMVNVIGMGYIGLPTALMLASKGIHVVGTDNNKKVIKKLNKHHLTFEEAGMQQIFEKAVANDIVFSEKFYPSDMYIVAVPTPYMKKDKRVDASYIIKAIESILKVCEDGAIIIIESTVSPGTIDKYIRPIVYKKIHLVHAPERIIPGNMIYELIHNSRVIGADYDEIGKKVKNVYEAFCQGEIVVTDIRTAEMTKIVENTYRDINIAFANELAKICRSDDMDVYEIIKIANMHPRVNILQPGPGVGGHCISVDPWFLVGDYPGLANIVLAARKINDSMPEFVLERAADIMAENNITEVGRVGVYGLAYKENVDDLRESPTLQMLECMKKHLAGKVKVYDPYFPVGTIDNQSESFEEFLEEVEMIIIMVAHSQIVENMDKLKEKIILDTKNICEGKKVYRL